MIPYFPHAIVTTIFVGFVSSALAVPIPAEKKDDIVADPANFIPAGKFVPLPGKIIAVLAADPQPVLNREGRTGPADQLGIAWNGGSYRWAYLPDAAGPIANFSVPLPDGKTKVYPKLRLASPTAVKPLGIDSRYALVEVEVNDGRGSPATDSFVATNLKKLDGSKEYPIQTATAIADLQKQYQAFQSEKRKDHDAVMSKAAETAIKGREPTGPREESTLMFITWLPETERLQVRFLTKITDGGYKYANGINIELSPAPVRAEEQGTIAPSRLANGLRYGTQFGIEYGQEYQVSKTGNVETKKTLSARAFQKELPRPPLFKK